MIELQQIHKSFGDNNVLNNISLTINKGQIFGLIGKNGAGKTTLLSIIAGLSDVDKGAVLINGTSISRNNPSRLVGYLPDVPTFWDYLTAEQYINFLSKNRKGTKKQNLLELVKVKPQTIINSMSRGVRQRLGLAAALVNNPDIILLDEPTSALDPEGRYEFADILLELKKQNKTIILSSHILTDMEKTCDAFGFLHRGKLTQLSDIRSLANSATIEIVFESSLQPSIFKDLPYIAECIYNNTIKLSFDNMPIETQKKIFGKLTLLDNPIVQINSIKTTLEDFFKEICQ